MWRYQLGRVINPSSASTHRKQLLRLVALANHELIQADELDGHSRDLAAFICLTLDSVSQSVAQTAASWEKRDYWVKADQFRRDWNWVDMITRAMKQAIFSDSFDQVKKTAQDAKVKLSDVKLPAKYKQVTPWNGAWDRLQKENKR